MIYVWISSNENELHNEFELKNHVWK